MADLETTGYAPVAHTQSDIEALPTLIGKLGDDTMRLLDAKLGLLKVEAGEDAKFYGTNAAFIAVGGVIAAIGFALVNVAVALFISSFFDSDSFSPPVRYALGFIITGVLYLVIGGIVVIIFKNRMTARSPVPNRSVEEIRKDKQWLKNETQG
ncbi:MAG: phage holin family protein [Pyrinomonadaceae bacterium MAG19_C2-C3]|nr:phage holin family protein [Pyrinomonadaceae bacterium MAG19_C2-C3]